MNPLNVALFTVLSILTVLIICYARGLWEARYGGWLATARIKRALEYLLLSVGCIVAFIGGCVLITYARKWGGYWVVVEIISGGLAATGMIFFFIACLLFVLTPFLSARWVKDSLFRKRQW